VAHFVNKPAYRQLVDRINQHPQGAPPSDLLYKILQMLFSEKEAGLVALLPMKPVTPAKAARVWKMKVVEAEKILNDLASRAVLIDIERNGEMVYVLPPPMAGFFEFSMMRVRHDIDQKLLSELFYEYLNVEEDFIKGLFTHGETQLGRVFVQERALSEENALIVMEYERASEVIKTASHRGVSICYCRHKMMHLGRACDAPMEICMTFNAVASSLIRHGIARSIDVSEGMDLLAKAWDHNLVQFGENSREKVAFICNCCSCCCEAMQAAQKFAFLHPVHTTRFMPEVSSDACKGCGKCVDLCPVAAMTLVSAADPHAPEGRVARVDEERCLGCGVCVRNCPMDAIELNLRSERILTPLNSSHRNVLMAIERGKLQNLILDTHVLQNHRALAALLGTILRLPPIKQALASQQLRSRYLEAIIRRFSGESRD